MSFDVPPPFAGQWQLKIRDKERVEPPHVSVLRGTRCWRWGLRERAFLDDEPPPRAVPKEVVQHIESIHDAICSAWDSAYPHNPVSSQEITDD
jgi:hypothetical protein